MTYYGSHYEQEQRRAAERASAPKECPHCHAPINQNLSAWEKVRYHCGADRCRKAASRANIAERKQKERDDTRARVLQYCYDRLSNDQRRLIMIMTDMLMRYSHDEGHRIAEQIIQVIESERCKHDRISVLIDNAAIAKRRAEKAEEHNRQLKIIYDQRIEELEAEIHVYQLLENAVHNIATRQLEKQPDPQPKAAPEPEVSRIDPERERTLAILAQAGIKTIEEAQAAGEWEDDTEGYAGEEYDEEE